MTDDQPAIAVLAWLKKLRDDFYPGRADLLTLICLLEKPEWAEIIRQGVDPSNRRHDRPTRLKSLLDLLGQWRWSHHAEWNALTRLLKEKRITDDLFCPALRVTVVERKLLSKEVWDPD